MSEPFFLIPARQSAGTVIPIRLAYGLYDVSCHVKSCTLATHGMAEAEEAYADLLSLVSPWGLVH